MADPRPPEVSERVQARDAAPALRRIGVYIVGVDLGAVLLQLLYVGVSGELAVLTLTLPTVVLGGAAIVGLRWLGRGEASRAVRLWAGEIAAMAVYLAALSPSLGAVAAVMLMVSVALAIPHVGRDQSRRLPIALGLLSLVCAAERSFVPEHAFLTARFVKLLDLGSLPVTCLLGCMAIGYAVNVVGELREREAALNAEAELGAQALELERARVSLAESAQRVAEVTAKAQSSFLANMSHEIRTPMSAVIGAAGLLNRASLDPRQKELVDTIQTTADHLLAIINDILDLSKFEAGKVAIQKEPLEIAACIEQATDLVGHLAIEKGLDLAYAIDDAVPRAIASDIARLRQILVNLLSNALKFTKVGEVFIQVSLASTRRVYSVGDEVEIAFSVRDTGIGMTDEEQARLFQPFAQANATTAVNFGGTGLGLVLSKRLSEALGGSIRLSSVKGKGTTFTFVIRATVAASPTLAIDTSQLDGLPVVIVDDSSIQRELIQRMIAEWGMVASNAATATAAHDLAVRLRPAVVIVGKRLRDEEGHPLVDLLREDPRCEGVPLIFAGSEALSDDEASPFAALVRKPLKRSILRDTLLQVIAGKQRRTTTSGRDGDPTLGLRHPLSILIAEDNPVNQKIGLYMLEALGYTADAVNDGLKAYAAVVAGGYDLVLMDLHMPGLDGAEAARRIRAEMKPGECPRIVGLTAAVLDDEQALVAETMDGYLPKPVTLASLLAALWATKPLARSIERRAAAVEEAFAEAMRRLGPEQMTQAVDELAKDVEGTLARIAAAAEASDGKTVGELARSLRERAESIGAVGVVAELKALEVRGRKRSLKGVRSDLRALSREMASFRNRAISRGTRPGAEHSSDRAHSPPSSPR